MKSSTAAGPDAFALAHLRVILPPCAITGLNATGLSALNDVINQFSQASMSPEVHAVITGARLTTLPKPNGDVRPVAEGTILRRLTAKVLLRTTLANTILHLQPEQHATAEKHSIDRMFQKLRNVMVRNRYRDEFVTVIVDARNAFNTTERHNMLHAVYANCPMIVRWTQFIHDSADHPLITKRIVVRSMEET